MGFTRLLKSMVFLKKKVKKTVRESRQSYISHDRVRFGAIILASAGLPALLPMSEDTTLKGKTSKAKARSRV